MFNSPLCVSNRVCVSERLTAHSNMKVGSGYDILYIRLFEMLCILLLIVLNRCNLKSFPYVKCTLAKCSSCRKMLVCDFN